MKNLVVNMESYRPSGDVLDISLRGNIAISELINSFSITEGFNIEKDFIELDNRNISSKDGNYDYAFAFFSLSNIISRSRLLNVAKEVNRVLKHEGRFVIWDVNMPRTKLSNDFNLKLTFPDKRHIDIPMKIYFNPFRIGYKKTLLLLKKGNFKIIDTYVENDMYYIEAQKKRR